MNLGAPELLVLLGIVSLFGLVFLAIPIWAIVDAARRPEWQFDATGQSKTLWIALPAAGFFVCFLVSFVAGIVYLASVRPQLERASPRSGWSYGYDAPPPPRPPGTQWPGPPRG